MSVDVIDVRWLQAGLPERHLHRAIAARAFRMRCGDVISIAGEAVTDDLGIDLRTPRFRMLIFLEHDDTGSLAHDEAVAVLVVRTAGLLWLVVELSAERA